MSESRATNTHVIENATCTFCGCVCDDMILTVEGTGRDAKITQAKNACILGKAWFFEHKIEDHPVVTLGEPEGGTGRLPTSAIAPRVDKPPVPPSRRPASLEEGIERAAEILVNARYPVVYGLSDTTCEAQRVAVAIADWIGGAIDTTTSVCHGPSGMAFQGVGEVTCSLGEIKNRADLVIFWGSNPADSHPRHFTRYSVTPKGLFVPRGKKDRTVVLVDVRKTKSANAANIFLRIKPRKDFEALWALRALVKGVKLDDSVEQETGIPLAQLEDLAQRMKTCKFGVLLFGMGLSMTRGKHLNVEAALALARDLNQYTRFTAKPMRGHGNVTGADNVVSWQTGFPFGVSLHRGYPRFNPGEFTTADLLARGEADAAMILASDPMSNFNQPAREHLKRIPVILLDPKFTPTAEIAAVHFTTSVYGINTGGTVYRMDDVPIPLRPAFESPFPSDYQILSAIEKRVRQHQALRHSQTQAAL